jgi:hypothetical protein
MMTKNTNKMPLFERAVDKIVTDNSAVIAALNVRIAELEKNISMLEQYNGSVESLIKDIEAHNLEQHSLAVNNFANKFCGDATTKYQVQLTIDAHCWCEMLDSKALKAGN